MFDVGFWELVILFGLGLMILGPERMPKVASQIGRWAGQARRMARNLSNQMRDELQPLDSAMKSMDQAARKDYSKHRPEVGQQAEPGSTPEKNTESADTATTGNSNSTAATDPTATADKQP